MFKKIETPDEGERVVLVDKYGDPHVAEYHEGRYVVGWTNGRPMCLGLGIAPPDSKVYRWTGPRAKVELNQMKPSDYGETARVFGDIPAYWSPLSFEMVEGRKARREEIAKHNVIEVGNEMPKGMKEIN